MKTDRITQRTVEIIIGSITWLVVTSSIWGSFLIPNIMAVLIILMAVYWFYKSANYAISAIIGYRLIRRAERENWLEKAQELPEYEKVEHIIILPNYKEHEDKIRINLAHLSDQTLPAKKLHVVLAMEEREGESANDKAKKLTKEFADTFASITATFHPDVAGELKGKSSNEAWAGKCIKQKLIDTEKRNINYFTITTCDIDSLFDGQYFARLTYLFLTNPNRYRMFWQGFLTEYANLDRTILPIKLVSAISATIMMAFPLQENFFLPQSTYSLSLKMADDVGFWDTDIIPEDWHMYFKCFFAFKGDVKTEAVYLPIHGDAIEGNSFWDAIKNRYVQNRRHAWGVTDIPYIIKQWGRHPEIPIHKKGYLLLKTYESHFLWPTSWFLLTLGVNLPLIINPKLKETVLGYNFSTFAGQVLTVCLIFTLIFVILDLLARPPQIKHESFFRRILSFTQWLLMPIVTLFLSTLPGLDAHTRILFNKRIEYKVAEKMVGPKGDAHE